MNAILDALEKNGYDTNINMPITTEKLWSVINKS
jgi:hypothetical protein